MKHNLLFSIALLSMLIIPQSAHAYLDPGTGSMVWQVLVAVGLGAAFTVKTYWQRIKLFLKKNKTNKPENKE